LELVFEVRISILSAISMPGVSDAKRLISVSNVQSLHVRKLPRHIERNAFGMPTASEKQTSLWVDTTCESTRQTDLSIQALEGRESFTVQCAESIGSVLPG